MPNLVKPSQSYMDFFINNRKSNQKIEEDEPIAIKGTCNSMCPDEESILRKRERMVHILEVVGNKHNLVKCYSRPAADTNLAVAHNLRPFHVLKETVNYLLFEVTKRTDASTLVIYNFVTDRLRAVRQDIIIQNFNPELRITLIEPMIRFHVFYGYLLCDASLNDYSPTLNRNILVECLKTCLSCYDELELKNVTESHNMTCLINQMFQCSIHENDQKPGQNRELVEALYIFTILYDESPMWRLRALRENVRHAPLVRLAYKLAMAALSGRYISVSKYIPHLCPLTFCAVALLLPTLQRRALQVMSIAYSCGARSTAVPLRAVRTWLCVDEAAAHSTLLHYGLSESGGQVFFQRGSFRHDAPILPPRKITAEHLEGKMNIDYVLTYVSGDLNSDA